MQRPSPTRSDKTGSSRTPRAQVLGIPFRRTGRQEAGVGNACVSRSGPPAIVGSSSGPGSASMPANFFAQTTRGRVSDAANDSGHAATVQVRLGPPVKLSSH